METQAVRQFNNFYDAYIVIKSKVRSPRNFENIHYLGILFRKHPLFEDFIISEPTMLDFGCEYLFFIRENFYI